VKFDVSDNDGLYELEWRISFRPGFDSLVINANDVQDVIVGEPGW
jgi:hypothetical protein